MSRVQRMERQVVVSDEPTVVYGDGVFQTAQAVDYILGIVEVMLGLRFVLELFGANASAMFVRAVYALTSPLVAPFRAIFRPVSEQGATFEWSVIVAMVVYAVVALAIIRLVEIISDRA